MPPELPREQAVPNEETRMAMLRAEAKMYGLIPDDNPWFNNIGDFIAYLEADDISDLAYSRKANENNEK